MFEQDNILIQRYLLSIYKSLGKLIEITFRDDKKAVGLFGGFNHLNRDILIFNFCYVDSERLEKKKTISFESVLFFLIRNTDSHDHVYQLNSDKSDLKVGKSKSCLEPIKRQDIKADRKERGIKNDVFKIDNEISKKKEVTSKVFKKFQNIELVSGDLLENETRGPFDQFAANHIQFGIGADFNENDYTTHLDLASVSKERRERAERIEKEIMHSNGSEVNPSRHILEERNLIDLKDNDNENEEALYSAVVREDENTKKPEFIIDKNKKINKESFRIQISKNYIRSKQVTKDNNPQDGLLKQLSSPNVPVTQTQIPVNQYFPMNQMPAQAYPDKSFHPVNYGPQMAYYQTNGYAYPMMNQGYPNTPYYQK